MRARWVAAAALGGTALLGVGPAWAENPVFDAETAADIAAAFAEASQAQQICYGVVLEVLDETYSGYGGTYVVSSAGVDQPTQQPTCARFVELQAQLHYTSEFSEAGDSARWFVASNFSRFNEADLSRAGLSAGDLTDDGKSEQTLLNAALALPRLAAETSPDVPPIVLTPATESPPADARATGSPGSDRIRQHGTTLAVLAIVALGSLGWAVSLLRTRSWPVSASRRRPAPMSRDDYYDVHHEPPRPERY